MSIHYINQLNYPNLEYSTCTSTGGLTGEQNTFAWSGCGVCCFIMGVEALTGERIPLFEGIKYAQDSGSTANYGTELTVLFEYAAPKYGLTYETTNDIDTLKNRVKNGAVAIANTGGDRDGYKCPFSPRGHYVYIVSIDDDYCTVFDTSYRPEKYESWIPSGEVEVIDNMFVRVKTSFFDRACNNKNPRYCILKKN